MGPPTREKKLTPNFTPPHPPEKIDMFNYNKNSILFTKFDESYINIQPRYLIKLPDIVLIVYY